MNSENQQNKIIFVVDTNILIGFSLWCPIPIFPDFWDKLAEKLEDGDWVLLDVVMNEIKYNKDLEKWCKDQKGKGLIVELPDDSRNRSVVINNQFPMINEVNKSEVDTYLLAFAEINGYGVCSRESERDPMKKDALYKIPDVCKILKIKNIRKPETFLNHIDVRLPKTK